MGGIRSGVLGFALCVALAGAATPAAAEPAPGSAGWIFDPGKVVAIDLTLSPSAEAELETEPDEYVEGGFAISTTEGGPGGEEHLVESRSPVGIRLKGGANGSFRPLSGKAAFKIKFKQFQGGSKFEGLKKLTLNNMVEDFSLIHETLAYTAYRGAGLPASRTGYAFVRVNGQAYGVYLTVEDMDDVGLERWFGKFDDPQHLYEGEAGADVKPGADALPVGEGGFEVDEGDEANLDDLKALIAAVNSTEGEGWSAAVAPVADLAELTRMWAVEKYVGHWDGYAGQAGTFQPNNYFLYSDPLGVFQMIPWGTDETWERRLPFDGPAGLMFNRCLADPACEELYRQELRSVGQAIAGLHLDSLASSEADLLEPWEEADPKLEHPGQVEGKVAQALSFITDRPGELASWLGTEEPAPPEDETQGPGAQQPTAQATQVTRLSPPDEPPPPDPPKMRLRTIRAAAGVLGTHLTLPSAGEVKQTATIRTADGVINACVAQLSVTGAEEATLSCHLSPEVRRRLRARWLKLEVRTRFTPQEGSAESLARQVFVPRD
jgi:CotH kinase protein